MSHIHYYSLCRQDSPTLAAAPNCTNDPEHGAPIAACAPAAWGAFFKLHTLGQKGRTDYSKEL
jgi:hypothetical protein